jgi:hypothetical protein
VTVTRASGAAEESASEQIEAGLFDSSLEQFENVVTVESDIRQNWRRNR